MKNFSNKWLFSLHTLLFHVNVFDATRSSASDVCIDMCFECSSFYLCFRLFIIVIKPFSLKRMWKHEYIFYFSHPIVPPNYCTSTQVQLSCVDNDLLRVVFWRQEVLCDGLGSTAFVNMWESIGVYRKLLISLVPSVNCRSCFLNLLYCEPCHCCCFFLPKTTNGFRKMQRADFFFL